jgi:hypothetical protein
MINLRRYTTISVCAAICSGLLVSQDSAEEPAKSSPKKVPSFHIPDAPKGYDFNMETEKGVAYRIPNAGAKHFPFFIDYEGNIIPRGSRAIGGFKVQYGYLSSTKCLVSP